MTLIVPSFQTFNRNQTLKTTAINLKSDLRQAQDNAFSGRRQDADWGCVSSGPNEESLFGWYVKVWSISPDNSKYEVRGACMLKTNYSLGTEFTGKDVKLASGVTVNAIEKGTLGPPYSSAGSPIYVLFKSVTNNVGFYDEAGFCQPFCPGTEISGASQVRITLSMGSSEHYVYIKNTGEIYESKP